MNERNPSRRQAALSLATLLALPIAPRIWAQSNRPITWFVGQPAGGSVDILTRLVARQIEQILGQPVVVENRPGASGAIALQAAAKAAPDGFTLVTAPGPVLTNVPIPLVGKELTGVATLARGPMVLVGTGASALPKTLEGLLAFARKDPNALSYASSGNGTSQHLAGELMNQIAHTSIVHIPYKGGSQAVTDVVSGQVPLGMLGITPVLPHIKAGKLHAYGVSTANRSAMLLDVPTLSEAGLSGFEADQWFVVAAPAGLQKEKARALNAAVVQALQKPEVIAGYTNAGVTPASATPDQTTSFVGHELSRWQELAKRRKLQLD